MHIIHAELDRLALRSHYVPAESGVGILAPLRPARSQHLPNVDSVKDGLAKVCRDVQLLTNEVHGLRKRLGEFSRGRDLKPYVSYVGFDWVQRPQTDPPRQEIAELLHDLKDTDNLEIPIRALVAIAKDLDSALRDIRATRMDIDGISNDSDLRAEFRNWRG